MSNNKKSFLLHIDSLEILDDLTDDQAGKLFKAIYSHQKEEYFKLDQIVKMVFLPFKNQFERDNEKYKKTCAKRAIAGAKGGKQKVVNASNCKQTLANVADNKNKNKNKTKNKNKNENDKDITDRFNEFWDLYGKKTDHSKCKQKFLKLKQSEVDIIFNKLSAYIESTSDKQYRKNPLTWINGKCWNDEITQPANNSKPTHDLEKQNYTSGFF